VLFDVHGQIVTSRTDLADFKKPFAQDRAPIATFLEAVEAVRPTGIIGVSAVSESFARDRGDGEDQRPSDHYPVLQSISPAPRPLAPH
jgi:malic enzyme-like protein